MSEPTFDPSQAVTFDLSHGQVHLEDAPQRVLVPASALGALLASSQPEASRAFADALGGPLGNRVAKRLANVGAASVEAVVNHLGGELALAGLGSLSLERWGKALLFLVDQSPLDAAGDALVAGVLAAALRAATGRELTLVPLMRDGARARFLVASEATAAKARGLVGEGASWGDVLTRLHAESGKASS